MPELWFTSDLHLGHGNIIRYCDRPFFSPEERDRLANESGDHESGRFKVSPETIERHDDALIDALNESVAPDDTLWILGDFSLSPVEEAAAYRARIQCRHVNFVRGNHDSPHYDPLFERTPSNRTLLF